MFGAVAVKHMAMEAKSRPPKKARGMVSRKSGEVIRGMGVKMLAVAITVSTMVAFMVARVAPHKSSPAITSSTLMGVAMMASNVFWKYMRTNEEKVHSKNDPFMMATATSAGAIKLI